MATLISAVHNTVFVCVLKEEIDSLCFHKTPEHWDVLPTHMSAVCVLRHILLFKAALLAWDGGHQLLVPSEKWASAGPRKATDKCERVPSPAYVVTVWLTTLSLAFCLTTPNHKHTSQEPENVPPYCFSVSVFYQYFNVHWGRALFNYFLYLLFIKTIIFKRVIAKSARILPLIYCSRSSKGQQMEILK